MALAHEHVPGPSGPASVVLELGPGVATVPIVGSDTTRELQPEP